MTTEGILIAVKQVELSVVDRESASREYKKCKTEVDILKDMRHENVVRYEFDFNILTYKL